MQRIWKKYFKDLYKIDTREQVAVNMCGFGGVQRGNNFGGLPIRRTEVKLKLKKLKNGKTARKHEVTGQILKGGGDMVVD